MSIPDDHASLDAARLDAYIANIQAELDQGDYDRAEKEEMSEAFFYNYFDPRRRPFFRYHIYPLWLGAVKSVFSKHRNPRVLELGCGTGTSCLLFASLGADVVGVDLSPRIIGVSRKRLAAYRQQRPDISAEFVAGDVFDLDLEALGAFDVVYSLFAFNLMQPTSGLLEKLDRVMRPGGLFHVSDGNWLSLLRARAYRPDPMGRLTPPRMRAAVERLGWSVDGLEYHCIVAPFLWNWPGMAEAMVKVEGRMRRTALYRRLAVSYTIRAEKPGRE